MRPGRLRRHREQDAVPILGVDSDNGAEFINVYLFVWCRNREITFTRARPTNKNDGCHVEQKNWAVVRTVVGYHRYDTAPELLLLNEIWQLQSQLTNYFYPQQKLISKVRDGAKVTKKYDKAATPFRRAIDHPDTTADRIAALARTHALINPAATQRQIQALTTQLLKMTTSKSGATTRPESLSAHNHMRQRIHPRAHLDMRQHGPDKSSQCRSPVTGCPTPVRTCRIGTPAQSRAGTD